MTRWDSIQGLPVQNPPILEFGARDLVWSRLEGWAEKKDRVAKIPFGRVDDFVRGESNNRDCPTRFHVESRRRPNGILEFIMYWCSFGPDDHKKGGPVRPSRTTFVLKNKPSGRPNMKRGCRCHFIVKRLSADPSVVLIIYNDHRHVDRNGSPCHGPQDKKSSGTRAMIENSASNLTDSIQHGGELEATGCAAPSLLETGKAFAIKGMQVLEKVGKETMDLLISETGIQVEKKSDGGPEQLEELEGLSNHYALLFNRRKAKLSCEQKSFFDGKLKEVHHMFDLGADLVGLITDLEKGKKIEAVNVDSIDEFKRLHDSSLSKAAELATGFVSALAGLSPNDIIQRTCERLDALHSEGVHRLSEMCYFAVTQILMLGKSITSNANKVEDEEIEETIKIDWPEDSVEKAKIIRSNAQSMTGNMEAVSNSFITGISKVAEAYVAAIKGVTADSQDIHPQKYVQEKASALTENLRADHSTAVAKLQDRLQFLTYLVLSSSMPAAA